MSYELIHKPLVVHILIINKTFCYISYNLTDPCALLKVLLTKYRPTSNMVTDRPACFTNCPCSRWIDKSKFAIQSRFIHPHRVH